MHFVQSQGLFTWARLTGLARFALGSYEIPRWEKTKDPGKEFWRYIRETKQTWRNTKKLTFGSIIASVTLNGMLMMWKIQQAMEDDASRTARIHPDVHGKISSPFSEISGTKPARSLIWTHRKFYKGFRGKLRQNLGNLASAINRAQNNLLFRADKGWAVKRALRSSFLNEERSTLKCVMHHTSHIKMCDAFNVGLARALFPRFWCASRPAKFSFLQTGNPLFFL